jgi:hypothetical protein
MYFQHPTRLRSPVQMRSADPNKRLTGMVFASCRHADECLFAQSSKLAKCVCLCFQTTLHTRRGCMCVITLVTLSVSAPNCSSICTRRKKSSKRTFTVNFLMGEKDKKGNILKAANLEHISSNEQKIVGVIFT